MTDGSPLSRGSRLGETPGRAAKGQRTPEGCQSEPFYPGARYVTQTPGPIPWLAFTLALLLSVANFRAAAQVPPLQYTQPALLVDTNFALGINWQSYRGVPISSTATNGSDGRYNITNGPSIVPATTNQFRGILGFSGITAQGSTNVNTNLSFAANVVNLKWPHSTSDNTPNGPVSLILRSAQFGAPYLGQQVSYYFGQVVSVPTTDENGITLTNISPQAYWFPMPFTTNGYTNAPFYWSPNAQAVFATQPGGIDITWQKATPTNSQPPDYTPGIYYTQAGYFYRLYTVHYIVSGAPIKTPQKMYWTEGSFQDTGKPVDVPTARVSAVNVIYYTNFPMRVANPYQDPNYVPPVGSTNMFQESRTLWFDSTRSQILAYNVEGRVFVELLGELNPDGVTRKFLGFEIVDVFKQPIPQNVTAELGTRVPAYPNAAQDDSLLFPYPLLAIDQSFYHQQAISGSDRVTLYATRETMNLNDFLVHWLIEGVAGLRWPFLYDRYTEVWPSDPAKYSHYLRPLVATEAQAQLTAVQLPSSEAPSIAWQDPLDVPRAKLTPTFAFYTFLQPPYYTHRTLLQYNLGNQVAYERVFSWLDTAVMSPSNCVSTVATNLSAWDSTNLVFHFANPFAAPYAVTNAVNVGARIQPPAGELGYSGSYWAGYILQTNGNSFNPGAYIDPFAAGFDRANQGSIIPVNAIPGHNLLEIWWFRPNQPDLKNGFQYIYWPAVVGRYNIQWPAVAPEIVLASNAGSGPLDSLRQKGTIYTQNDPTLPGYNPNEEHAVMLAGQAYALRDDLNITTHTNNEYSSDPYVLIDYTGPDGLPSMSVFKVRREKPEAGILFDYISEAGSLLQAPMPLPLLEQPLDGSGPTATNYNAEPPATSGDLPVNWTSAYSTGPYGYYPRFTYQDRKHNFWVYRGLHAGLPALQAGDYNPVTGNFDPLPPAVAVTNQPFAYYIHTSRRVASLTISCTSSNLPVGISLQTTTNGLYLVGTPTVTSSNLLTLVIQDVSDNTFATNTLSLVVAATGAVSALGPLAITSTNQYSAAVVTYTNRPPHLAVPPTTNNCFTMNYYYKTLPGFAWPGVANPPPVGTIVPYLRTTNPVSGGYVGSATNKFTPSLSIVYRPVWPALINGLPVPTLRAGQTLTVAENGLAGVRGQSSALVLYQQSVATNINAAVPSVSLIDPTVAKQSYLGYFGIFGLPASIRSTPYAGRFYFPDLPPNLVKRVYFDPNTTNLVFQGQFVDDPVGEKYVFLNVLRGADLAAVQNLCSDPLIQPLWASAVQNLRTPVYTFRLDPVNYVPDQSKTYWSYAGDLVTVNSSDTQVDSYALSATGPGGGYITYIVGNGVNPIHAGEPVSVYVARVAPPLFSGELKVVLSDNPLSEQLTFQHTSDLAGDTMDYQYDWRIMPPVDGQPPTIDPTNWVILAQGSDLAHYTMGGSAGIQALSDNYVVLRYRCTNSFANPAITNWSAWTQPVLAEGWIKRVLAGINPFNQRTTDLFNNPVNTTASIIAQAGHRWEGDVALNADTINSFGLIEIYETILHRGEMLSVNAGINYGPANDALLLAAGYLSDLYMYIGNDAWADAANPTIGIGTADKNYGNIATALFAFKGEVASLLDEEMGLLRGRDDFLAPGVDLKPVYNRLWWNYTRGIADGEVIYALNYNITDQNSDGVVNAADAAMMFPQGHGDAYGHYLTALKNYYYLLMNPNFSWVPTSEAVSILGATVSVNYQHERKFAAAAAALARAGRQTFDLTWRQNYRPGTTAGWASFGATTPNLQHSYVAGGSTNYVTRYWGADHWATRTGQGAYLNWVVGNAIIPAVDPDPTHQGIQKVDRTTVPELTELPTTFNQLQTDLDNAEAGLTPLGVPQDALAFDINPLQVTGPNPQTHFEQVYQRAVGTLNNAVVAFNDAQNVTQLMRSEEDSLTTFQDGVTKQELAYNNQIIEIYGTPYPDDMGPGRTWPQNYTGPDLIHYMYVENPESTFGGALSDPSLQQTFNIDIQQLPPDWLTNMYNNFDFLVANSSPNYNQGLQYISFTIGPDGFYGKPAGWTTKRQSPGKVQQAISALLSAQNKLRQEMSDTVQDKLALDKAVAALDAKSNLLDQVAILQNTNIWLQQFINSTLESYNIADKWLQQGITVAGDVRQALADSLPKDTIFGLADGGDLLFPARAAIYTVTAIGKFAMEALDATYYSIVQDTVLGAQQDMSNYSQQINYMQLDQTLKDAVLSLAAQLNTFQKHLPTINQRLRDVDDAQRAYDAVVAQGNRLQQERLTFRQHAAAIVQGYRTRDAAFRIFQNEKLERYKTLFDLAAQYAFLAANAYDYETGLLNTDAGRAFVNRIVSSRALGVVQNGQPQYAGSDTGDPGLSSALAEMKADWDVLKGRLGFNNPDGYGTTASLRAENFRILPGSDGDNNWKTLLQQSTVPNLLADSDVTRYCMQIDDGSGLPVPGIILTFSTVIANNLNLFGQTLAPGDHAYSASSFATKIFAVGVDFDGYIGMDNPVGSTNSPGDPNALSANPYVYLIPVGTDSMRSPPLGDTSTIRTWTVDDVTIPLPFNISASSFSTTPFWQSSASLSEPLFAIRKHQAFRPVSTTAAFNTGIYGASGALQPSEYTNKRLIGRSVWNSKWKLVIPGRTLLNDPNQGISRFVNSVKDVKLYFITYSYAGN